MSAASFARFTTGWRCISVLVSDWADDDAENMELPGVEMAAADDPEPAAVAVTAADADDDDAAAPALDPAAMIIAEDEDDEEDAKGPRLML